jgi:glycosyltransferase involved in cell wall biosynthesis
MTDSRLLKTPIKVLIDGIHLVREMKGVGLYVSNTLKEMAAIDTSAHFIVAVIDESPISFLPQSSNIEYIRIPWRNHLWHGFKTLPELTRKFNPDVVWVPYETPAGFLNKPYVISCHDIPEMIRSAQTYWRPRTAIEYLRDKVYDLLLQRTFRKARTVFSNSHFVADWLKSEQKIDQSRIRLAPCAPGADFREMSQEIKQETVWHKLGTPDGYILVFYTGDPRENIGIIPEVFDALVRQGIQVALVVAGVRDGVRTYVNHLFSSFPWRDRVRLVPFLPADKAFELAEVYTAALAYLEPSLHEGFGMQVVEAMSCGVPIVCSNRGALPEVVSDAAVMVDPVNVLEISQALITLLSDNSLKEKLVSRGYKRASFFNWTKTARIIYNGLIDACGNVYLCMVRQA